MVKNDSKTNSDFNCERCAQLQVGLLIQIHSMGTSMFVYCATLHVDLSGILTSVMTH